MLMFVSLTIWSYMIDIYILYLQHPCLSIVLYLFPIVQDIYQDPLLHQIELDLQILMIRQYHSVHVLISPRINDLNIPNKHYKCQIFKKNVMKVYYNIRLFLLVRRGDNTKIILFPIYIHTYIPSCKAPIVGTNPIDNLGSKLFRNVRYDCIVL